MDCVQIVHEVSFGDFGVSKSMSLVTILCPLFLHGIKGLQVGFGNRFMDFISQRCLRGWVLPAANVGDTVAEIIQLNASGKVELP